MRNQPDKVFLGGTCGDSTWRKKLLENLKLSSFNPVVENWTAECQQEEYRQKNDECNVHLYVITKEMTGVFSIAEVLDSVHTKGITTILHIIPSGFSEEQLRSLRAVVHLVKMRGGIAYIDQNLVRTSILLDIGFGYRDES